MPIVAHRWFYSSWMTIAFVVVAAAIASAQQDATVKFDFAWESYHPSQYSITVHKNGRVEYFSDDRGLTPPQERNTPAESNAEREQQSQDAASQDVLRKEFTASDGLRQKVFDLAEKANFFDGQFDFTAHPIAKTGSKTLSYKDASRSHSTTYNYSEDPSIQQLTAIFQGISGTIEAGQKLEFDRRFDKLSLDADLRSLDDESKDGHLEEVQVIAPLLQRLATDRAVLHIAQKHAENILKRAGLPVAPSGSP